MGFFKRNKQSAECYSLPHQSVITPTRFDLLLKEWMPGEALCGKMESVWGLH